MYNETYVKQTTHHGWQLPAVETLLTWPSLITMVRTMLAAAFAIVAALTHSEQWLLAALLTYWVGDILDGIVARWLHQETRSGAIFDIMADRLCVALIYIIFGLWHGPLIIPVGLYLFEFIFIDGFLSLSFLFWKLLSPNYFFLVDKQIFQLNWSPLGKVVNSSFFLIATVVFQNLWLSLGIAALVLVVKFYSLYRLYTVVKLPTT